MVRMECTRRPACFSKRRCAVPIRYIRRQAGELSAFVSRCPTGTTGLPFTCLLTPHRSSWFALGAIVVGRLRHGYAAAGITGFEALDMPTLLDRGTTTAPWLSAVVGLLAKPLPQARLLELKAGDACILEGASEFVSAVADHTAAA